MTGSMLSQKPHRGTDREARYSPPVLPDVIVPETTTQYNKDKEKTGEQRPDGTELHYLYGATDARLKQAQIFTPGGLSQPGSGDIQPQFSYSFYSE